MWTWLRNFVTPDNIWDILSLVVVLGGGTVIGAIKKLRDAWAKPVLYGVAGGGIIFFYMWLSIQLYQHFKSLERVMSEQKTTIEGLAKEQRGGLERLGREQNAAFGKLSEALRESANQQKAALEKLAKDKPTRPYFTSTTAKIYRISGGKVYLTVSLQNNEVPAEKVVSHLLVINETLDPKMAPLHSNRMESANPIGPGGFHGHHWGPIKVPKRARPAYVVLQIRYIHALSGEEYRQALFLKFKGASITGTYFTSLFNASSDEKKRIERYMNRRGIAKL